MLSILAIKSFVNFARNTRVIVMFFATFQNDLAIVKYVMAKRGFACSGWLSKKHMYKAVCVEVEPVATI